MCPWNYFVAMLNFTQSIIKRHSLVSASHLIIVFPIEIKENNTYLIASSSKSSFQFPTRVLLENEGPP